MAASSSRLGVSGAEIAVSDVGVLVKCPVFPTYCRNRMSIDQEMYLSPYLHCMWLWCKCEFLKEWRHFEFNNVEMSAVTMTAYLQHGVVFSVLKS
jgi:hypothetical protein